MNDETTTRRELKAQYRERKTEAAVYRILNSRNGKSLLGTTTNLEALRNRVDFAKSTGSPSGFDGRLAADIREFGLAAFSLEILEVLPMTAEKSRTTLLNELKLLEQLWREKLGGQPLY